MTTSTARARGTAKTREDRLDLVFHALSDRTRRALVARLSKNPAKITDLAQPFEMSLPAVSKHVRVLERAGIVRRSIDGRIHRCTLQASAFEEADQWIARHRSMWAQALDALADFVEKGKP